MFKIDERKELIKGDSKFNKTHISFICSSHSITALVFQAVNSGLGYNFPSHNKSASHSHSSWTVFVAECPIFHFLLLLFRHSVAAIEA